MSEFSFLVAASGLLQKISPPDMFLVCLLQEERNTLIQGNSVCKIVPC